MQQDEMKRKAKLKLEVESATERDEEDVNSETPQNETENLINRDDYINESMAILSDYINLQKQSIKNE